ncbi:GvpL/GvpF family gas vesicle protein [Saccharopolyspora elongata]|uniref:GvpL/GvpF family gas vesicle protein n=1 Tax=Saccharopolyspora elongata TaxID=2530387 RepID=A0A4R4YS89_9PSEU|nr:GvpL/GvpF family gas vesicle protein [Saccharopolyspora elongata]TDD48148.1 GvpL/GvpF family gas vesicle protein [Saccharopolyspora elongata]
MTTQAERDRNADAAPPESTHGIYVYGILGSSYALPDDLASIGDDETPVRLVSHEGLAAAISEVNLNRPLGTPDDLRSHEEVLDTIAAERTVLPMRFGAVVSSVDAVVDELLAQHHELFEAALAELDGTVQFTVGGRYLDSAHIREVVAEQPEVRELRESLQGVPPEAGYDERLRLGEMVSNAVVAKREADANQLIEAMSPYVAGTAVHEVGGEDDAFDVAMLVERGRRDDFENALDGLGEQWSGRIQLRLVGPLAPYDFLPER